jgi:hypothetical protein
MDENPSPFTIIHNNLIQEKLLPVKAGVFTKNNSI